MTTPERLRRRQIRNDWFIAVLAACLVFGWLYFDARDDARRKCLSTFVALDSETGAVRSRQVELESRATRRIILDGTTAKSRAEFAKVRMRYVRALAAVDKARAEHPVEPFPKGVCD